MIALAIILGLIFLIIAALAVPVVLQVEYNESLQLKLRWLFLRRQLVPAPPAKKKKEKPKKDKPESEKQDKPKEEGPKKPNIFARYYEYQGVAGFVELLRRTVAALKKFRHGLWLSFCIRDLNLAIRLPGDDPEQLAVQYGKISAMVFPPLGWLAASLRTKKGHVRANIYPDFLGQGKREIACRATVSIIPLFVLVSGFMLLVRLGFRVVLKFVRGARPPKELKQKTSMQKER